MGLAAIGNRAGYSKAQTPRKARERSEMNWPAITIICIWIVCAIAGTITKDPVWPIMALLATGIIGMGYLMLSGK